jgi:hypothetical protein
MLLASSHLGLGLPTAPHLRPTSIRYIRYTRFTQAASCPTASHTVISTPQWPHNTPVLINSSPLDNHTVIRRKHMLHRPDLAHNELLDGAHVVIPPVIENIMAKAWTQHFSLAFLHPEFLCSPDAARFAKISLGITAGSKSSDQLLEASTGGTCIKLEQDMGQEEWLNSWEHLMPLIKKHLPEACEAWTKHWCMIYSHHNCQTHWNRLMLYCIKIRQSATQVNFNPGKWQSQVYEEITEQDRDDAARRRAMPPRTLPSSSAPTASFTPLSSAPSNSTPKKPKLAREVNPSEQCFCCGYKGHYVKECVASKQHNCSSIITRRSGNKWLLDGASFCYSFNTLKGCAKSPCPNPPHLCSLCRSPDHSTQACSA